MAFEIWLAYAITAMVVTVIPGPTLLTVITQSVTHGRVSVAPLVLGVICGDALALILSLFGLGALLATSVAWFSLVKWVGALYLIYIGISLWRNSGNALAKATAQDDDNKTSAVPVARSFFMNSFVITTFNPKGILFFIAFLPQFVNPNANVTLQLVILAVTFIIIGAFNALVYAIFSSGLTDFLKNKTASLWFNRCGGSVLIGAGVWAATVQRP